MKYLFILVFIIAGCGTFLHENPVSEDIKRWDRCEGIVMRLQCQNISRSLDMSMCRRKLMNNYVDLINSDALDHQKKTYLKRYGCPPWMVD